MRVKERLKKGNKRRKYEGERMARIERDTAPRGYRKRLYKRARGAGTPKLKKMKRDAEGHFVFEEDGEDFVYYPDDLEIRNYEEELDQIEEEENEYELMENEGENPTDIEEPEEIQMENENVYNEGGREYFLGLDQLNSTEYGLTLGYEDGEYIDECAYCGKPLEYEEGGFVEARINGRLFHFCSYEHAQRFFRRIGLVDGAEREF